MLSAQPSSYRSIARTRPIARLLNGQCRKDVGLAWSYYETLEERGYYRRTCTIPPPYLRVRHLGRRSKMKRAFMHEGKEDRSLEFAHPGKPCDEARLANIESTLGKVLPPRYREVIMTTGGGILGINTRVILDSHSSSRDDEVFHIDQMWGNGATTNGSDNNIDSVVPFLADEYQIPDSVLLFATSNSGMHGYFVINYYLEGYPPGSVLYVDDEINGQITKISDTFDQFIGNVQQDTESPSGRDYGTPQLTPVEGAKKGALSEDLIRMVDTALSEMPKN